MKRIHSFAVAISLVALVATAPVSFGMNKAELIDAIAKDANLSKADSKRALEGFIGATEGALKKGDRVALVGFGSFSISKRAARTGRNPQTGKEIQIAAKNVVKFKAGADLAKKVKSAGGSNGYAFAGEVSPAFQGCIAEFFHKRAAQLAAEAGLDPEEAAAFIRAARLAAGFEAFIAEKGAEVGEIDAFDSPSIDGVTGIATSLDAKKKSRGRGERPDWDFNDLFIAVVNDVLASGDIVEVDGFGTFGTEETADGQVLATFEVEFDLGLQLILGIHKELLDSLKKELKEVEDQAKEIAKEIDKLLDGERGSDREVDGAKRYADLLTSALVLAGLADDFGDEPIIHEMDGMLRLIVNQEDDFAKFYDKGNQAAGTRVRKGMQDLKNLAQDIRKEVQSIKNK